MNFAAIIQSPLFKFALVLVAVIAALVVINMVSTKENMSTVEESKAEIVDPSLQEVKEVSPVDLGDFSEVALPKNGLEITPDDLLPKTDEVKQFEDQFPKGQGDIKGKSFLIASNRNFGINTVGSTLKNANLQLRSDPQIPRVDVGPWGNSTIEASDLTNRKVFEIGV